MIGAIKAPRPNEKCKLYKNGAQYCPHKPRHLTLPPVSIPPLAKFMKNMQIDKPIIPVFHGAAMKNAP